MSPGILERRDTERVIEVRVMVAVPTLDKLSCLNSGASRLA